MLIIFLSINSSRIVGAGVDLLFCNMVTYATSSVFAPIVQTVNTPMVLVALQPAKALDYNKVCTFMQLENDNICSVPEFTGVAIRMGKKVQDVIIGTLYDDVLDVYETVTEHEIQDKIRVIDAEFDMPALKSDPVTSKLTEEDKYQAAKTAVALDKFVEKFNLTGLAYYYEGQNDNKLHQQHIKLAGNTYFVKCSELHQKKLEVATPLPNTQAAVIIRLPQATLEISEGDSQQTVQAVLLALQSVC